MMQLQQPLSFFREILKSEHTKQYSSNDNDNISDTPLLISSEIFNEEPEEICHYTKTSHQLKYNDISGLSVIKIRIDNNNSTSHLHLTKKNRTRKNRTKKKANANACPNRNEKGPSIIGADLKEGFNNDYIRPSQMEIYLLDDVLGSIQYLVSNKLLLMTDLKFITTRRHLSKLMGILLDNQPVAFNVIYWKGLIFFVYDWRFKDEINAESSHGDDQENDHQNNHQNNHQDNHQSNHQSVNHSLVETEAQSADNIRRLELLQYCGFKFEEIITTSQTLTTSSVFSKFYTVVKHKFNGIPVVYTAEVDCAVDNVPGLANYVELKTHSILLDDKAKTVNKFLRKLMALYCQNKFISCKNSVVGFRSADCKLASMKTYSERDLVNTLRASPIPFGNGYSFNTKHIFHWYRHVLHWLSTMDDDNDNNKDNPRVFKLCFERTREFVDSSLVLKPVLENESSTIFNTFVPKRFQDFINTTPL